MNDPIISTTCTSFTADVVAAPTPVVVEFTARWCAPCRRLEPILHELAVRYLGRVRVVAVDVEAAPELAQAYRITSMPTLLGFRAGAVVAQQVGFGSRAPIMRLFESLASAAGEAPASS
jgi:thioredoxin 1